MKFASLSPNRVNRPYLLSFFFLTSLILSLTVVSQTALAQQMPLSLADILIGLRSKKVILLERNRLLTDAVKQRGITFTLTPEIEKELAGTGADRELIEAIRQKSPIIKAVPTPIPTPQPTPVATPVPVPVATPIPTPPAPDFAFYRKRADENIVKGEYDLAVTDYSKAIELNGKDPSAYINRGLAFYNKKNYDLAVADYDKAIELSPKESMLYFNRGNSYEKSGNVQKAADDYRKAYELDANNEAAKLSLQRIQAEQAKVTPKPNTQEKTSVTEPTKTSTLPPVELGSLIGMAVTLVKPVYSSSAQRFNIEGQVTVQVTLDEEGNVTAAKATAGPQMLRSTSEDAARKSKFKPAMVGNQAVKATGFITYNFKAN